MHSIYRNRTAIFIWIFTIFWNLGVGCLGYVSFREKIYEEDPRYWFFLAIFFSAGVGLAAYANRQYCTTVKVSDLQILTVVWRYPFKTIHYSMAASDIQSATVFETKDSEGDPYYKSQFRIVNAGNTLKLPTDIVVIRESSIRSICEQTCQTFNQAVFSQRF